MQQTKSGATLNESLRSWFAIIVIIAGLAVAHIIFHTVFGADDNFIDNNPENAAKGGNMMGTIYKGGWVVPVLMSTTIILLVFIIERFITLQRANGKGSIVGFLRKIKSQLGANQIDAAIAESDRQKGSVANVVQAGLRKYKDVTADPSLNTEEKSAAITKELEEATSLELPMLERNLVIIATIASISTLLGLFGTVLGMIRAFAALAQAGQPDPVALSEGISEALINTALGIGTSAIAIIAYNSFTSKIDVLTYRIDEAGFSISQSLAEKAAHVKTAGQPVA